MGLLAVGLEKRGDTMIQKFIELGEGYADVYEILELGNEMTNRVDKIIAFHTVKNEKEVTSIAIVMNPSKMGDFQPIYICLEGIPYPKNNTSKRYQLFEQLAENLDKPLIELEVKPSTSFNEKQLYYQHLIGILRLNHILAPLS